MRLIVGGAGVPERWRNLRGVGGPSGGLVSSESAERSGKSGANGTRHPPAASTAGAPKPTVNVDAEQVDMQEKLFLSEGHKGEMHNGEKYPLPW